MKKAVRTLWLSITCLFLIFICLVIGFNMHKKNEEQSPLKVIDEVEDKYGNILQQVYYNEDTGEYLLKEYIYTYVKNKFICTDQQTTIINKKPDCKNDKSTIDNTLEIYHNKDLTNGPIILIDNEDVTISIIKYLATDRWWKFGYELKVVNKSNEVLSILIDDSSIMSIRCKPLFTIEHIEPNQTAYFTVAWQEEELERCHIPYVDNIEFMIRVFSNETFNYKKSALYGNKILIKTGGN